MAWTEDKTRRVAIKWVIYLSLIGLTLLIGLVLDRNTTHDLHKTRTDRVCAAIGALITLGLFSFLFGDNEFYRFLEHLIVGVVAAVALAMTFQEAFNPMWLKPVGQGLSVLTGGGIEPSTIDARIYWGVGCALLGFISLYVLFTLRLPIAGWISSTVLFGVGAVLFEHVRGLTDGTWNLKLLWLLAPIPGSLWYTIYSKRYVWLSRLIIVLMIGAYTGKAFQQNFRNLLSQLHGTFKPVWIPMPGGEFSMKWMLDWLGSILFVVIAFVVLFYFVFTFRTGDHPMGRRVHVGSRMFMMIAFGIVFGTVVGTRMGLITDRIYFLVEEWAKPIVNSWFGG